MLLAMAIGVPLAWLTVRTDLPFPRLFTVAVTLPLVIPSYIGAFAYHWTFRPRGEFQSFLAELGLGFVPVGTQSVRVLDGLNHLFQASETGRPSEYATIDETLNPVLLERVTAWILERFGAR